jgi:type VI secretion system protein ImpG
VVPCGHEAEARLTDNGGGTGGGTFRTTADVQLLPLHLVSASFRATATAPAGTRVPTGTTSILSIDLELSCAKASWSDLGTDTLRFFLDGDRSLVTVLREALASQVLATMVQTADSAAWAIDVPARAADARMVRGTGFDDDDALIEIEPRGHSIFRLLTEYFAFPEKFNFVDVPLPLATRGCTHPRLSLHLALGKLRRGADDMAVLRQITADNLCLGCAPVINLFAQRTSSQSVTPGVQSQPIVLDPTSPRAFEINAIKQVCRVKRSPEGETMQVIPPFYSLQHGNRGRDGDGAYWIAQRSAEGDSGFKSAGFKTGISFVDLEMEPVDSEVGDFFIDVLASNGDLSSRIRIGKSEGDFALDSSATWTKIQFLTRPTPPYRFQLEGGKTWLLISQLSTNTLLLSDDGIEALKAILSLYDPLGQPINQRIRDGLIAIRWMSVLDFPDPEQSDYLTRGAAITLEVDDDCFVDVGLQLFADLLDRLFALCAHVNSFTQLTLVSARTGGVLVTCAPRMGSHHLL